MEDIVLDGLFFEKKVSSNRYLKGDRRIDVSPAPDKVEVPDDGEYWLYCRGCNSVVIQNEIVKNFHEVPLKAYIM